MCRQRPLDSNGSVSPVVLHTRRCDIVALPLALTVVIKLHSTQCAVERARTARAQRTGTAEVQAASAVRVRGLGTDARISVNMHTVDGRRHRMAGMSKDVGMALAPAASRTMDYSVCL